MKQSELKNKIDELENFIEEGVMEHLAVWTLNNKIGEYKKELVEFKKMCIHTDDSGLTTFNKNNGEMTCAICGQIK